MKAQLAQRGGREDAATDGRRQQGVLPGNNDLDAVAQWAAWLQGKVAMIFSWPPTGRMSENYAQRDKAINFVPHSAIAGKVGYAVVPGGNGEMASGYVKALADGFAERRGGLSVHAVGHQPAGIAGTRDASLHAARSVSPVALTNRRLPSPLARRRRTI